MAYWAPWFSYWTCFFSIAIFNCQRATGFWGTRCSNKFKQTHLTEITPHICIYIYIYINVPKRRVNIYICVCWTHIYNHIVIHEYLNIPLYSHYIPLISHWTTIYLGKFCNISLTWKSFGQLFGDDFPNHDKPGFGWEQGSVGMKFTLITSYYISPYNHGKLYYITINYTT